MIRLTEKKVIFQWSSTCQKAFNQLKINVTQIFILRHFDKFKKTILKIDFLDYVNDKILSQYNDESVLHSVIFYNKNLTSTEYNYQIYDKKLFVIIRYLKH